MDTVQTIPYRRVYVWELPVRLYHWINALVIVLLAVSGYLIGNPQAIFSADEAYQLYWFGWVRFIHFAAAYIYFFNFLFRIYWGFVGNKYARWNRFIPVKKQQLKDLLEVLKVDIVESKLRGRISVGHNILAGISYFFTFLVFLLQALTGFALYSSMSEGFIPRLFGWVIPLFGGDAAVRQWHHILMWFFVSFVIVHVYLVFYHDYVEGRGTTSSIIGGWKFVRDDEIKK
ncbi:MAG: Ni/Fe-hydrogenase, b-type cytochrome subunit [Acidobacteriota bacterium]|nr:Ni/Fe-hydrogenase, b-type cytochrome subunit [Acidobacteriota bacterium]MDH3529336.1 Ni/Fe-hydrogenase, b-type cytochrome subunit [Acidobacteriota bacterium]